MQRVADEYRAVWDVNGEPILRNVIERYQYADGVLWDAQIALWEALNNETLAHRPTAPTSGSPGTSGNPPAGLL
jgi:hypothetical protein